MVFPETIPGVYRRPTLRPLRFARVRTDVVGFIGFAGENHLHEPQRIEDWSDYVRTYLQDGAGVPLEDRPGARIDGSLLPEVVRAYFANGGDRCWVLSVGYVPETPAEAAAGLAKMMGWPPVPPGHRRTGLEQLIEHVSEASYVDIPDLFARFPAAHGPDEPLPPRHDHSEFVECPSFEVAPASTAAVPDASPPLYDDATILAAQQAIVDRVALVAWRMFALLSVPRGRDATGAESWRDDLARFDNCAALYWPWLDVFARPGDTPRPLPGGSLAAGIFARRDLERGAHASPANERLHDAVAVEAEAVGLDDERHAILYDKGINVFRSFPTTGIQLWGERTLVWNGSDPGDALSYIHNRRCLSAIERSTAELGQGAVFEPHTVWLRFQLAQAILTYLAQIYRSGVLAGDRPEQAFAVISDTSNNAASDVADGRLVVDVKVALAAAAEFITFRLGRREGAIEIEER